MNSATGEQRAWPRGFRLAAGVAGLNALVSVGFAVSIVVADPDTTAWYAADRAGALLVALIVVAALRNRVGLQVVGWLLVAVQAADALVGLGAGDVTKTTGPVVLAVATATALTRMMRMRRASR